MANAAPLHVMDVGAREPCASSWTCAVTVVPLQVLSQSPCAAAAVLAPLSAARRQRAPGSAHGDAIGRHQTAIPNGCRHPLRTSPRLAALHRASILQPSPARCHRTYLGPWTRTRTRLRTHPTHPTPASTASSPRACAEPLPCCECPPIAGGGVTSTPVALRCNN
jgi:hypothetical protein